jgi:ABC-type Zn2+ transport system substrate-binding protein/surface adhesin
MAAGGTDDTTMTEPHGTPEAHDERDHVPDTHGTSHAVEGTHGSSSDHGDDGGHDDHGHVATALGPIDWPMWAVGAIGVLVAIVITAGFVIATGFAFNA